jgi:hypothetical protein
MASFRLMSRPLLGDRRPWPIHVDCDENIQFDLGQQLFELPESRYLMFANWSPSR